MARKRLLHLAVLVIFILTTCCLSGKYASSSSEQKTSILLSKNSAQSFLGKPRSRQRRGICEEKRECCEEVSEGIHHEEREECREETGTRPTTSNCPASCSWGR